MLFKRKNLMEPEPVAEPQAVPELISAPADPIALAALEEKAATIQVQEMSIICNRLDAEQRSWQSRRDAAYKAFCEASERYSAAKQEVARLSKIADVSSVFAAVGRAS
jgi:hypothetical protein